jgi:hypothetical protein
MVQLAGVPGALPTFVTGRPPQNRLSTVQRGCAGVSGRKSNAVVFVFKRMIIVPGDCRVQSRRASVQPKFEGEAGTVTFPQSI